MHKLKKHFSSYPDKTQVRQANHRVCQALAKLGELGIQIEAIDMKSAVPLIVVLHCPGTEHIKHSHAGLSQRHGVMSVQRESYLNGCRITWSEVP